MALNEVIDPVRAAGAMKVSLEHFPFASAHGQCSSSLFWRATLSDQLIQSDRMLL